MLRERRNDQNGVFSQMYHKNFQMQAITKLQTAGDKQSPSKMKSGLMNDQTSLLSGSIGKINRTTSSSMKGARAGSSANKNSPEGPNATLSTDPGAAQQQKTSGRNGRPGGTGTSTNVTEGDQ